ncbi:MAG: TPM domain-containing protein [Candidatus Omnitrophica bacterium]|nr:TPM domain-containing protein [Candidatus Omnitrophota bacterium]
MKRKILLTLGLSVALFSTAVVNAQNIVACQGKMVCDQTGFLSNDQIRGLTEYHAALLERYDIDLKVVVATNVGDIGLKAAAMFKELGVGEKSSTRKGVLLLIDPAQDKVRMEIPAGLDAVYTDGFVTYLQQRQMVPFFSAGRVADGVLATTELIVGRAQKAAKNEEFIAPENLPTILAIGAGAQTKASISKGYLAPAGGPDVSGAGMSPQQVVDAYHQALAQGNASPDLSIYSRATKDLKRSWVVTPAQMKMELNTYQSCQVDKVSTAQNGQMAFVRYGVRQRQCAPYFLVKEDGEWKLDFSTMMQYIRFNVENKWHFDMSRVSPSVLSAFADWQFDKNGYPY